MKQNYTTCILNIQDGKNKGKFFIAGRVPASCTHETPGIYQVNHNSNIYDTPELALEAVLKDEFVAGQPDWKIQVWPDYIVATVEQLVGGRS